MMFRLNVPTRRGFVLNGVLFRQGKKRTADTVMIAITGALLVGTYDNFTDGDPSEFLRNLNNHMPEAKKNKLIFIEKTGHTYQKKNQEVADDILHQLQEWRAR